VGLGTEFQVRKQVTGGRSLVWQAVFTCMESHLAQNRKLLAPGSVVHEYRAGVGTLCHDQANSFWLAAGRKGILFAACIPVLLTTVGTILPCIR
jgi:hypothetical protein